MAVVGATRAARCAGSHAAMKATTASKTAVETRIRGSDGLI
jgi:hypothetical protein